MCGICGAFAPDLPEVVLREAIQRMTESLHHRGPDAQGTLVESGVPLALGHARLSILDLSDAGRQPMETADGRYVIVFNGEIYNFRELREELCRDRSFVSRSDTEVALAAFERLGSEAFARFNGMFALAIFDRARQRLTLARDRLGIKPLFIGRKGGRIAFGSEIKAVVAGGVLEAIPDFSHLHEYLYFGSTLGESTFFDGIQRLEPGHWVEFDLRSGEVLTAQPYWSVPTQFRATNKVTELAAVQDTRDLLSAAVRRQLVSDVPVGVFLSGGIDSTALVALAAPYYSGRLRTYSVGFDYIGDGAELPKARWVAERFGTEHHELHVTAANITGVIERMARAHDQPFGDAANLPLYQLCDALQDDTKVVLQGDGGDELFGGYRRYSYLSGGAWGAGLAGLASTGLRVAGRVLGPRYFGAMRFFDALAKADPAERMSLLLTVESPLSPPTRILSAERRHAIEQQDPFARYREVVARATMRTDRLQSMLWTDLQILLPDIFLEKVDRATMASSIEVRVPFLDHDLVDYVGGLPAAMKVTAGQRKKLLKKVLQGIVPDEILNAPKLGFGVPVSKWLAGPLRRYAEERVMALAAPDGWFDRHQVRAMFDEHAAGRRDHSQILWKSLQFALWCEQQPWRHRAALVAQ